MRSYCKKGDFTAGRSVVCGRSSVSHCVYLSGFKTSFPMKASTPAPATTLPAPPPGLGISATKPPPGFTGIPLNSNVVEPAPSAVNP